MADENKSVRTIQVVAIAIALVAIGGIVWAVGYGGGFLADAARVNGLIKFAAAIVTFAIVLIVVFYFVTGGNTSADSKIFTRELMDTVRKVTPMQWVASLIGLFTIGGIIWVIASGDDILQNAEKTRGLITFSVAIVTVSIALIMVFYLVFGLGESAEIKERFTFGKDILMVFVGILGTIMGFYYGADNLSKDQIKNIADVVQKPAGVQDPEQAAFDLLLKKDFNGALKAFDDAFNATPALPNIADIAAIRKILTDNRAGFAAAAGDEVKEKEIWQKIFCGISTAGMTEERKKTVDSYCRPAPSPTPTPSPAETQ